VRVASSVCRQAPPLQVRVGVFVFTLGMQRMARQGPLCWLWAPVKEALVERFTLRLVRLLLVLLEAPSPSSPVHPLLGTVATCALPLLLLATVGAVAT
jgi:hypothetical protein